jgi:hypothetical protein
MKTTIITKDGQEVTIEHRKEIPEHEIEKLQSMALLRLYHVGYICGFVWRINL